MRIRLKPDAISKYCATHDISRDELARRMKVATTTCWRVDAGKVDPSPKFIAALVTTTGQPFESLFEIVSTAA